MLTNFQLEDLSKKMDIPLKTICFKDELKESGKLEYNKAYIINLQNEYDEDGKMNGGSHWTCFQVNKYPSGNICGVYHDSFGTAPPESVKEFVGMDLPYTQIDIQSLAADFCGWSCCAFLHYINAFDDRTGHIYKDTEDFCNLFVDLNKSCDYKYNEYVLKHFFLSADPLLRKDVNADVKTIVS